MKSPPFNRGQVQDKPVDFEENFTFAEVEEMLSSSLPPGCATITAPTEGPASLGFELLIHKANGSSASPSMQPQL